MVLLEMTYIPVATATVSTVNSTTAALGAGATFTGTAEDVVQYSSISISYYIQPYTATGNLFVQFSNTASPFYPVSNTVTPIVSGVTSNGFTLDFITQAQYFRVSYVNDSTPQTALMIQSIYHPQARIAVKTNRTAELFTDYTDCIDTRSLLWGKTLGGGKYEQVATNGDNSLVTTVVEPRGAFGAMDVSQDTPTCQVDFIYGINTNLTSNTTASGGVVGWYNGMANVTTVATVSSSASLLSKRYVRYRPGEGAKARFTSMFTTGQAGNTQLAGIADGTTDGLFWGYNGTSFGIMYRNRSVDTWIPQASWNIDQMDGRFGSPSGQTLDPTKLNVYQIKYQYLGGGNMFFYVLNSITGRFDLVHLIRNANTQTQTNFRNPSMNMLWTTYNSVSSTAVCKVSGGSCALFVEGVRTFLGPLVSEDAYLTAVPNTTLTSVLAVRNATTFNGIPNRAFLHLRSVSVAINGGTTATIVILRIIKNYTSGPTTFVPLNGTTADNGVTITNGQACTSSSVPAPTTYVTVSGGSQVFSTVVSATSLATFDLTSYDISIFPGDTVSFAAFGTASTPLVGVTAVWNEDI
jgi:hypothetical protein